MLPAAAVRDPVDWASGTRASLRAGIRVTGCEERTGGRLILLRQCHMKAIIQILHDRRLARAVVNTRLRTGEKAVRKATGYWSTPREIVIEDSVLVRMQRMSSRR